MKKFRILILLLMIEFCPSVRAQDMMNAVLDVNSHFQSMIDFAGVMNMNAAVKASARNAASRSNTPNSSPNVNSSVQVLRFQPSAAVSQRILNNLIKALQKANPQSAAEIERKLQQQDVIADFSRDMAPYGLRADDVADTMTAYWLTMWIIANQEAIPSVSKVQAVQNQVRTVMLQNPYVIQATATKRQEMAEAMIYETMIALGLLNNATRTGDSEQLQLLADSAYQNMLKQNIDLRDMQLTPSGFTRR